MKFLLDAQLPIRLARHLAAAGHDVVHTSELPEGNRTPDTSIAHRADTEGRVVVSKDRDFRDIHLLRGSPSRLLMVATATSPTTPCSTSSTVTSTPSWTPSQVHHSSSSAPIDSSSTVTVQMPAREPEK